MGILYITRHGETQWNTEWRLQGKKDSPLTEKGLLQAELLGKRLLSEPIDIIYSSPSTRAVHTAERIRKDRDIPIVMEPQLMEMGLGCWEGQRSDDIKTQYPEAFDAFWNAPERYVPVTSEAESFEEVRDRILQCVQGIMAKHLEETVLIVSHGISLKTLFLSFEDKPIESLFADVMIPSASLTRVDFNHKGHQFVYKNDISFQAAIKDYE